MLTVLTAGKRGSVLPELRHVFLIYGVCVWQAARRRAALIGRIFQQTTPQKHGDSVTGSFRQAAWNASREETQSSYSSSANESPCDTYGWCCWLFVSAIHKKSHQHSSAGSLHHFYQMIWFNWIRRGSTWRL